jgi:hypothetical protein
MPNWVKCGHVEPNDATECVTCLKLEISALQPVVDAAVDLVKWHGAGAIQGDRYLRLFSAAGNYYLKTIETLKVDEAACLCGHPGPDGQGDHTGPPWCEPMKRKTCVHPDCLAKKFGPCKGFATIKDAVDFITDERLGGP